MFVLCTYSCRKLYSYQGTYRAYVRSQIIKRVRAWGSCGVGMVSAASVQNIPLLQLEGRWKSATWLGCERKLAGRRRTNHLPSRTRYLPFVAIIEAKLPPRVTNNGPSLAAQQDGKETGHTQARGRSRKKLRSDHSGSAASILISSLSSVRRPTHRVKPDVQLILHSTAQRYSLWTSLDKPHHC